MKDISSRNMQISTTATDRQLSSYTLFELLLVFLLITGILVFPAFSFSSWQVEHAVYRFFGQFEKRIYAVQKSAIVNQQQTGFDYIKEKEKIRFRLPDDPLFDWEELKIPEALILQRSAPITFAARTGNESSLKAYQFYWPEKNKTVIYQFQMGGGHYTKKIE